MPISPAQQTLQPTPAQSVMPVQNWYPQPDPAVHPWLTTGRVRSTGLCVFLYVITLGIYGLIWYYSVHDEMKRHSGQGIGGGLALLLAFFVGFVNPFLVSSEVGQLYQRRGAPAPVSGMTGLWYIPGFMLLVGPIIWFAQTNNALNAYWRSVGAH
jgi:hypothetical protein